MIRLVNGVLVNEIFSGKNKLVVSMGKVEKDVLQKEIITYILEGKRVIFTYYHKTGSILVIDKDDEKDEEK